MTLPPFSRVHWSCEGCNRVHSQSGAALDLSDHLCRQTALNYYVRTHKHLCPLIISSFTGLFM